MEKDHIESFISIIFCLEGGFYCRLVLLRRKKLFRTAIVTYVDKFFTYLSTIINGHKRCDILIRRTYH